MTIELLYDSLEKFGRKVMIANASSIERESPIVGVSLLGRLKRDFGIFNHLVTTVHLAHNPNSLCWECLLNDLMEKYYHEHGGIEPV